MTDIKISRKKQMLYKAVIINGFPGCGKTMLSPIISSFDRVEIMQYSPLIEQMCELHLLGKVSEDVAESMIRMNADLLIYNVMMGRNSNCRMSDISSIFNHNPEEHIKRMLREGDEIIPSLIKKKKPILHLTTHMLFPSVNLLLSALKDKLVFVEVVRHPLYMIIQQEKNFKMFDGSRNQHVRYELNDDEFTFFSRFNEGKYSETNSFEKAIYSIDWYYSNLLSKVNNDAVLVIPFEKFVKSPDEFMNNISSLLSSPISDKVTKEMLNQKVPRKHLSNSPDLDIYKRCGWIPPISSSELEELEYRRSIVSKKISSEALNCLDKISEKYVHRFL